MQDSETHLERAPIAIDERSSKTGLRAVAGFEALKGAAVIVLMMVVVAVHTHAEDIAENLLFNLHIDPDLKMSQAFLNAASRLSDTRLLTIAAAALTYAAVRFVEAWGLWNRRVWAEWFALLSGTLYLPWEILKLMQRASWQHIVILSVNVVIVLYMLYVRIQSSRTPAALPAKTFTASR